MIAVDHVHATTYVEAEAVVQLPDRGLLVSQVGPHGEEQYIVREVRIRYRWSQHENKWAFVSALGYGPRLMPGTGYEGVTTKEVTAMHPDYRELARLYAPRWRPPKIEREL
jgi:hypothetical protein